MQFLHIPEKRSTQINCVLFFICAFLLLSSATASAQYTPLVGLPQVQGGGTGLAGYFNQLYMVAIAVGAILAFIKISIAGVKWSLSDIVTDKSDAKKDINGALLGLAILLIPFIVLNTIYPGLTNLNILQNASRLTPTPQQTTQTRFSDGSLVSTDPDTLARPQDYQTGAVVESWSCTVRGALIPGTDSPTNPEGPQYYPSTTDCQAQLARCNSEQYNYGTGVITVPNQTVRCSYSLVTVRECSPGADC